ncbi:substrate-binding domain-containing protein [Variovorax sp. J22R133]|uniref:substrate-binding domain-containing protein n=1 Tax=Variovorax brevis TaxID=3053503 RepID=UPI0025777F5E|nr:substrate-binding domain-containing protein [Variovorax sp. J22R133]MDM0114154.1 substrate-binding domain-containing protein [Variovorax sp. J22R133]
MNHPIRIISSMATRGLLEDLTLAHSERTGVAIALESVGGVEAARRVAAGEPFDIVALASDAIDKLVGAGHVDAANKIDVVRSGVGVAVRAGAARPDISTEDALRQAVRDAGRIGYSTGPSGIALIALFTRWGIAGDIGDRLVQAPPGVPVGSLVARGDVALGFQQMSELLHVEGIDLLGPLPDAVQITTVFSAAPCGGANASPAVRALLDYLISPEAVEAKRRHGMEPAP